MHISLHCSTETAIETKARQQGKSKNETQHQQKQQRRVWIPPPRPHPRAWQERETQRKSKSEFNIWHMRRWGLDTKFLSGIIRQPKCVHTAVHTAGTFLPPLFPSACPRFHRGDLLLLGT